MLAVEAKDVESPTVSGSGCASQVNWGRFDVVGTDVDRSGFMVPVAWLIGVKGSRSFLLLVCWPPHFWIIPVLLVLVDDSQDGVFASFCVTAQPNPAEPG